MSNQRSWPAREQCVKVVIKKYAQAIDETPESTTTITDKAIIDQLFSLLQKLAVDGDMMKSFIETVQFTILELDYGTTKDSVEIYQNHVKTPSTGFATAPEDIAVEKVFVDFVNSLIKK